MLNVVRQSSIFIVFVNEHVFIVQLLRYILPTANEFVYMGKKGY